ncbi:MBG domain-containing protein, partial [Wenzhouxiangella marina]
GNPKPVTVTTTPPGLSTTVTYDGGATVPTDVGSYAVEVTVDDPNYTGTASDTLEITAATATISITDTSQVYDGNPKPVTVTTTPPGLSTTVTYDGGATVPTDVGSYAVEVTVDDPNYTATASETLVITQATTVVSIDAVSPADQQAAGQSYTVTASVTGGQPTGLVTVDDGNGESCTIALPATSCDLISTVVGPTTLTADYPGDANHAAGSDSLPYEIVAGEAATVAFTVQASDVLVGAIMAPAVVVDVRDGQGNPVADGTPVALSLGNNPGGANLGGTVSVTTVTGVASFDDLTLDSSGIGYTLVATSGTASSTSQAFDVTAPALLEVSPPLIDFGEVVVGSNSNVQLVTLGNGGDLPLEVSTISSAAAPFELIPGQTSCTSVPFELNGGEQCQLAYRFSPTATGPADVAIAVLSDAGDEGVLLQGVGATDAVFDDRFEAPAPDSVD